MRDTFELLGYLLVAVIVIVVLGIGLVLAINPIMARGCRDAAQIMNVDYRYSFYTGCLIQIDGKFIPYDSYIVVKNDKR